MPAKTLLPPHKSPPIWFAVLGLAGVIILAPPLAAQEATSGQAALAAADVEFFEKQVRPLLVERCYACHAGTRNKGGLSLETADGWRKGGESGPSIVPGQPAESLLIEAINYRDLEMPPPENGGKLSADEIAVLTKWVEMGAPDPRSGSDIIGGMTREAARKWWAFQPLPSAEGDEGVEAIDRFIQDQLQLHNLQSVEPADKRTLIRRATYDLTGLPPTPEEVAAFLADDAPEAFERVIERLLASPQYGVQWGRHWLDVVRYADTAGENTDRPLPHAWRYRNWVIDSFNRDTSYDEFVRLQLAGDIIAAQEEESQRQEGIVATGYLAIARRFGHDIDKDMYLTYEDVIDNLGKNFLGLSLGCARCHPHKYDPVSAEDYYALYGVFESSRFTFPGCEPKGQPRDLVPLISQSEVEALTSEYQAKLAAFEERANVEPREAQRLKELATGHEQLLASAAVGEGMSVSIDNGNAQLSNGVALKKNEVLLLTVLPNGNHGADTTRVQLEISLEGESGSRTWNVEGLIDQFTQSGPAIEQRGATWCLLDSTEGPLYLRNRKESIEGKPELKGWAKGELPSSMVNASSEPVDVWTKLPPRAVFVHPNQGRNVAIAWICPEEGTFHIRGTVTDAHPAGLDGVSFRLEHIASADYGSGLKALGTATIEAPPSRPEPPSYPVAYAVVEANAKNALFQKRGDPEQTGDEVPRQWLTVFGGDQVANKGGSGRVELAERVTDNPLLARVMVNRIWGWHFGHGLVRSENDFGARGELPTHPELLEWLAARFAASGYRVKGIHRLIMLSAAYQRASGSPNAQDPENRWLAHFNRRRVTAEELRDSLLSVSAQLDPTPGEGHPFPPESTWTFTQHNPFTAVYDTNQRSAYLMVQRQRRHPFLALFDGADPNASTPIRQTTTVPTQALYFINDPFFHAQSNAFAETLMQLPDSSARIARAYDVVLQRQPSESESQRALTFIESYPASEAEKWSAFSRVLLASNEFLYVD